MNIYRITLTNPLTGEVTTMMVKAESRSKAKSKIVEKYVAIRTATAVEVDDHRSAGGKVFVVVERPAEPASEEPENQPEGEAQ